MADERSERLAILRDRANKSTSESGDLSEVLEIAKQLNEENTLLQQKLEEGEAWKSLLVATTDQMRRVNSALDRTEDALHPITVKEERRAIFYGMLGNPKIFLPVAFFTLILVAAFIGVVTIEPVTLSAPW
jgi:hypothetical protein